MEIKLDDSYYEWFEKQNNPNEVNNYRISAVDVKPIKLKTKFRARHKVPKSELCIGDEIINAELIKATVLDIDDDIIFVFTENGCVEEWNKDGVKQTGKKYNAEMILRYLIV